MAEIKMTVGMSDLYVAKMLTNTAAGATYSAPAQIGGAVSGTITPTIASATFYSNDKATVKVDEFTGAEITVGVDALDSDALSTLFGISKNADGVLEYTDSLNQDEFALLFRSKLSSGGYRYVAVLRTKPQLVADSFATKGENIDLAGKEINFSAMTREDGKWRFQVDSDDEGVNQTVITNWFTQVYAGPAGA
jgi:phi13 family phage major tail protein